jgi:hypothetical protein
MESQTPRFREGQKGMLDSSPPNPLHGHCRYSVAWLPELTCRRLSLSIEEVLEDQMGMKRFSRLFSGAIILLKVCVRLSFNFIPRLSMFK